MLIGSLFRLSALLQQMRLLGYVIGNPRTGQADFEAIDEISKWTYTVIPHGDAYIFGRIEEVVRRTGLQPGEVRRRILRGEPLEAEETVIGKLVLFRIIDGSRSRPVDVPPRGGSPVYEAPRELIMKALRISEPRRETAYIGRLYKYDVPVYLDINDLVPLHTVVLAQTGQGKSYFAGVVIEELLKKGVTVMVIDTHGEYVEMAKPAQRTRLHEEFGVEPRGYGDRILVFSPDPRPGEKRLQFTTKSLSASDILSMTGLRVSRRIQVILKRTLEMLKASGVPFTLADLAEQLVVDSDDPNLELLAEAILEVHRMGIFGERGVRLSELVERGKATIINLVGVPGRPRELVVARLIKTIFQKRKEGKVPPMLLVVEEAHNYIPERPGNALSKPIIATVAQEGRKFGLGLMVISQRPARVDKNVISQCNTKVIFKMEEKDLQAVQKSIEGFSSSLAQTITSLERGTCVVMSPSLPMPLIVRVRPRESRHGGISGRVL